MTDCQTCKFKDDCVNVGKFKDGDCLQYKKKKKAKDASDDVD